MTEARAGAATHTNTLGFSLLFGDHKALLRLEQRDLWPGLRLREFEAEIPGADFQLSGPVSLASYRHRPCRARRLVLAIDRRIAQARIEAALRGAQVGGLSIDALELMLDCPVRPPATSIACVVLDGAEPNGSRTTAAIPLHLGVVGRDLEIRASKPWFAGSKIDPQTLIAGVLERIDPDHALRCETGDGIRLDLAGALLPRLWAGAGWRAPNLADLVVERVELEAEAIVLSFADEAVAAELDGSASLRAADRIADAVSRSTAGLLDPNATPQTLATVLATVEEVAPLPRLRIALLRAVVQRARHRGPAFDNACLDALRRWTDLDPGDATARRMLVELLSRTGQLHELRDRTARLGADKPRGAARARIDLAVGLLSADRLGDDNRARALLEPLLEADVEQLGELRTVAHLALARARADAPRRARAIHESALRDVRDGVLRAEAHAALIRTLVDRDNLGAALALLRRASSDVDDTERLAPAVSRVASALGIPESLTTLLQLPLDASGRPLAPALTRIKALHALAEGRADADHALGHALATSPDDLELLRVAADRSPAASPEAWARYALAARARGHADAGAALAEVAVRCWRLGEWNRAARALAARLRLAPADAAVALDLGIALRRAGHARTGETIMFRSIRNGARPELGRLDPLGPGELERDLGNVWRERGDFQRAAALFELSVDRSPPGSARSLQSAMGLAEIAVVQAEATSDAAAQAAAERACYRVGELAADARERSLWLTRAASFASPEGAIVLLERALQQTPTDAPIAQRLAAALRECGRSGRLSELLWDRSRNEALPTDQRLASLRELITLSRDPPEDWKGPEAIQLHVAMRGLDPDDIDALLAVADHQARGHDEADARAAYSEALTRLPATDPRCATPAVVLARAALNAHKPSEALPLLLRAVAAVPEHDEAWALMARAGEAVISRDACLPRALHALAARTPDRSERVRLRLRLAEVYADCHAVDQALEAIMQASTIVAHASAQHLDVAEAWIELVNTHHLAPSVEAQARAELRAALGHELPPSELRTEALLLCERLGQPEAAMAVLEDGLRSRPHNRVLLATLKEICLAHADLSRYLGMLEHAVNGVPAGLSRDRLISELAACAAERDDPEGTLTALERLSSTAAGSTELLELRQWAIGRLGREGDELAAIAERLRSDCEDGVALARLRSLPPQSSAAARLVAIADGLPKPHASKLRNTALSWCQTPSDAPLVLALLEHALGDSNLELLDQHLAASLDAALSQGDEPTIAVALDLGLRAVREGCHTLVEALDDALGRAAAAYPANAQIHRMLWARTGDNKDLATRAELVGNRIDHLTADHDLGPAARAALLLGLAHQLPGDTGAELLRTQAEAECADPETVWPIADALVERGHLADAITALELVVRVHPSGTDSVSARKRIAHIAAAHLGDSQMATQQLVEALAVAPDDADVLLPLVDLRFERREFDEAVRLALRVLANVPLGDAAFLALAHRAADAAMAGLALDEAAMVLEAAAQRVPADQRTEQRLAELKALRGDPTKRVLILATIADRQSGTARHEALEERARLLVDPLDRVDEAIADLECILGEAPDRTDVRGRVKQLLARRERWIDLVALLEREVPRQHGARRCEVLREIARIHREHLHDHCAAERVLRLALDHLGAPTATSELAEAIRGELVVDLEGQGRFADLASYLERTLEPEVTGLVTARQANRVRLELLTKLARIYQGPLADEPKAARIYERLEALERLPDDGVAALIRSYQRSGRHTDLCRILMAQSNALTGSQATGRKAAIDQQIAALLEGPLGRPTEAANYYLAAFLSAPQEHAQAASRVRLLLAQHPSLGPMRERLLERIDETPRSHRSALLTLLGEVTSAQGGGEDEAEARYRQAIAIAGAYPQASEALGRLLARQGQLESAIAPLVEASRHPDLAPHRAADAAAIAAHALVELERPHDAEQLLEDALQRAPDSERAMFALARVYENLGRVAELANALERLSALPLARSRAADVSFRRAKILKTAFSHDPHGAEAERAKTLLLEAVSADGKHAEARRTLCELAATRLEWSLVAHMHYLGIRELSPGPARALVHLDLAHTYLVRLDDAPSAMRNIESAIAQAPRDLLVSIRATRLAERLPDLRRGAERFEHLATTATDLDEAARGRLWLIAVGLRRTTGDLGAANAACEHVLALHAAPREITVAATHALQQWSETSMRELQLQRSGLLELLAREESSEERVHLLDRLREVGRSLGDADVVERASREELDIIARLGGFAFERDSARHALRQALLERGALDEVVALCESMADSAPDVTILVHAARIAWHEMGAVHRAIDILLTAVTRRPDDYAVTLLAQAVEAADERATRKLVAERLAKIELDRLGPAAIVLRATLADQLGRPHEAIMLLHPLTRSRHDGTRAIALRLLDAIVARWGGQADRVPILRRLLDLSSAQDADDLPEIALDSARAEIAEGETERALVACRRGLQSDPSHRPLLGICAELLERAEAWDELAITLERLGEHTVDHDTQTHRYVEAARVRLRHQANDRDPKIRVIAMREARRLLQTARQHAPGHPLSRATQIPLAFREQQWDEVLDLGLELRELGGDNEATLILVGLTEAYRHGHRTLARDLGGRHNPSAHDRFLFPGLWGLLGEIARAGPLPRLDAVLAAGSALSGGRECLARGLRSWAAGRPVHPGLALGLARLAEADGDAGLARSLYQVSAFMAPRGPVRGLVERLPVAPLPPGLHPAGAGPLEGRSVLREALARLAVPLAGMSHQRPDTSPPPSTDAARSRLALAETMVAPWRRELQIALPLGWTEASPPGGVAVVNSDAPSIVLGPAAGTTSIAELQFRLARATAAIAMGLAVVEDACGYSLTALLAGVARAIDPAARALDPDARAVADRIASAGGSPVVAPAVERAALGKALTHWLRSQTDGLSAELRRAQLLFATRLSGQLDGALLCIAHDRGCMRDGRPDPNATLCTDDAQWLLRALGIY